MIHQLLPHLYPNEAARVIAVVREEEGVGHCAEGDVGEVVEGGAEGVALAGDPPLGADLVVVVLGAGLSQDQHAHQDVERLQGVVACNRQ